MAAHRTILPPPDAGDVPGLIEKIPPETAVAMKLGIFGGTFNPPHVGHLIVAESVRDQMQLDRIFFVPSASPPHKQDPAIAVPSARLQMTRLAVAGNTRFEVSEIELDREGPSYTIDTVAGIADLYPRGNLLLIIGVDNLLEFDSWKSPREILQKADLVVMTRPGFQIPDAKNEFIRASKIVHVPPIGISGTDIRRRIRMGRSIRYLVPEAVEDYILRRGLYK